jgi:glycosyltransferase involved in cell wall biosynthesis
MLRIYAAKWLLKYRKNFDIVLLRYVVGDFFVAINALIAKKYYTVHHTKELEEAAHFGRCVSKFSLAVEHILGKTALRKAAGIIAVTQEILDYERSRAVSGGAPENQPHHVYSNGLDFSQCALADDMRGGVPKLVFVAAVFQPWHGLDLLLEQINSSRELFELHLVGNIGGLNVDDSRVILHGTLSETEILKLLGKMDIGIGSLGMFRNQLKEAATLKVREYFANGLPVYATHRDAGLPPDFPYFYFHGTLDIKEIVKAAVDSRAHSRAAIRKQAEQYLSKVERLQQLNDQIMSDLSG